MTDDTETDPNVHRGTLTYEANGRTDSFTVTGDVWHGGAAPDPDDDSPDTVLLDLWDEGDTGRFDADLRLSPAEARQLGLRLIESAYMTEAVLAKE